MYFLKFLFFILELINENIIKNNFVSLYVVVVLVDIIVVI